MKSSFLKRTTFFAIRTKTAFMKRLLVFWPIFLMSKNKGEGIIFLRRLRSLVYADWLGRYFNQSPDTKLRKRRRNILPSPLVNVARWIINLAFIKNLHKRFSTFM